MERHGRWRVNGFILNATKTTKKDYEYRNLKTFFSRDFLEGIKK